MNNNCMVANHTQRKVITFCLDTNCQGNRVCCSMCQTEFHNGHFDQLVDCEFFLNFIESQVKQPSATSQVGQILTKLFSIQHYLEKLRNQIQLEIQRLSQSNLQQFCKSIGSNLKNKFESIGNDKWNDLLENMLLYVQISEGQIFERSPFVFQNGKEDFNFINQSTLIISNFQKSLKEIQSIINQKVKNPQNNNFPQLQIDISIFDYGVDVCKQRNLLVFGTDDSMVKLYSLENNSLLKTYPNSGLVYDVIFSNSGNMLAFGGSGDYTIKLIDIQNLKQEQELTELLGHNNTIRRLVFSQDSKYLISGSDDKTIRIWNIKSKVESFQLNSESQIRNISISHQNSLLASYSQDEQIRIWRIQDQKIIFSSPAEFQRAEITFLDDQSIVISSGQNSARKITTFRQKYYGIKRINQLRPFISKISFMILTAITIFILIRVFLWICGFTINGPSKNSLASQYQSYLKYVYPENTQQPQLQYLFGILQSTAMGNQNYLIIFSIFVGIIVQVIVQLSQLYINRHTRNRVINI